MTTREERFLSLMVFMIILLIDFCCDLGIKREIDKTIGLNIFAEGVLFVGFSIVVEMMFKGFLVNDDSYEHVPSIVEVAMLVIVVVSLHFGQIKIGNTKAQVNQKTNENEVKNG